MERTQAEHLTALIQAYFPVPALPDSTVAVWAQTLMEFDFAVAKQAVMDVGRRGTGGRPVQLGDIVNEARQLIRDETRDNARDDIFPPTREAIAEVAKSLPDDAKVILARYWEGVGKGRRARAIVKATANVDPEARVEAGRLAAQAAIEREMNPEETARIGAERPPKEPKELIQRGDVCAGVGKPGVMIDNVLCCSVCQSPIETWRKVWVRDGPKKGHFEEWREGGCYPSKAKVAANE